MLAAASPRRQASAYRHWPRPDDLLLDSMGGADLPHWPEAPTVSQLSQTEKKPSVCARTR
ncbi:hypothetical protein GCM10027258_85800 [Amycolatopsis stemonae]